jgi:hypothetical protein
MALLLRWRTNVDALGKTARETTLVLGRLQVQTATAAVELAVKWGSALPHLLCAYLLWKQSKVSNPRLELP